MSCWCIPNRRNKRSNRSLQWLKAGSAQNFSDIGKKNSKNICTIPEFTTLAPSFFNPILIRLILVCIVPVLLLYFLKQHRMFCTSAVSVHPEIQDGAPVFSGTRIRVETFIDFLRIGVSVNEFLDEFPSITRDQAQEVYSLVSQQYSLEQIRSMATGPDMSMPASPRVHSTISVSRLW